MAGARLPSMAQYPCSMIWGSCSQLHSVSVVSFIVIPLIVMIACYSVVFGAARRRTHCSTTSRATAWKCEPRTGVENESEGSKEG